MSQINVFWHANNYFTEGYSTKWDMLVPFVRRPKLFYGPTTRKVTKFSCCLTNYETHNTFVLQAVMLASLLTRHTAWGSMPPRCQVQNSSNLHVTAHALSPHPTLKHTRLSVRN
jgi:hypothetical protein